MACVAQDERVAQLEEGNAGLREQLVQRDARLAALEARLAALEARLAALETRLAALETRLAALDVRVGRTRPDSFMPPPGEVRSTPPVPNRTGRRAERRHGAQPSDEGRHLVQVKDPTAVLVHEPVARPNRRADLRSAGILGHEVRQVFELEVHRHVAEDRVAVRRCSCGGEVRAHAPREATAPTSDGPGVRALACCLAVFSPTPSDRMAEFLSVCRHRHGGNHQAERDVRIATVPQKVSGCWCKSEGARACCAIRSDISTMRTQNVGVLAGLRQRFDGHAWLPGGTCTFTTSRTCSFDASGANTARSRCHGTARWPADVASVVKPDLAVTFLRE